MFRFLLIAAFVPAFVFGQLQVDQCEFRPMPISVILAGCDELPCDLQSGEEFDVTIQFVAPEDTDYFYPSIFIDLGDGDRDYLELPEEHQTGCDHLLNDGSCPITAGTDLTYQLIFPFTSDLLEDAAFTVQFTLYDDDESTMACFRAPIVIRV